MIKKTLPILLALGLSALLLAGCGSSEPGPEPELAQTSVPSAVDPSSEGLLTHDWHLEAFGTIGEEDEVIPGTSITLRFKPDGILSGTGGCNNYSTTYQTESSGELAVRALATTQMECGADLVQQEHAYFAALADVTTFDVGAGRLQLFYGEDEYAMVFKGQPLEDSEPAD